MKIPFALALIVFCSFSIAEEKKSLSEYQTLDMKQFEGLNTQEKKSNIQFAINCKTDDGKEIKSTEPGYNECLAQAKNKAQK